MNEINLNELLTVSGLRILHDELQMRINDWRDVLDAEPDDEHAKETLQLLSKLNKAIEAQINVTRTEVYSVYAERSDITYIMEDTFVCGTLQSTECVGWYCGEPNDTANIQHANRDMKIIY